MSKNQTAAPEKVAEESAQVAAPAPEVTPAEPAPVEGVIVEMGGHKFRVTGA